MGYEGPHRVACLLDKIYLIQQPPVIPARDTLQVVILDIRYLAPLYLVYTQKNSYCKTISLFINYSKPFWNTESNISRSTHYSPNHDHQYPVHSLHEGYFRRGCSNEFEREGCCSASYDETSYQQWNPSTLPRHFSHLFTELRLQIREEWVAAERPQIISLETSPGNDQRN